VKIEWSPAATALARQYIRDQDGMRAMGAAIVGWEFEVSPFVRENPRRLRRHFAWPWIVL
jgi:hypothetical protein